MQDDIKDWFQCAKPFRAQRAGFYGEFPKSYIANHVFVVVELGEGLPAGWLPTSPGPGNREGGEEGNEYDLLRKSMLKTLTAFEMLCCSAA